MNTQSPIDTIPLPVPTELQLHATEINNGWVASDLIKDTLLTLFIKGYINVVSQNIRAVIWLRDRQYVSPCDEDMSRVRLTLLAYRLRPLLVFGKSAAPIYSVGDHVTLCPIEFDCSSYDGVFRIQFMHTDIFKLTPPEYYQQLAPSDTAVMARVLDQCAEYAELRHMTSDEFTKGERIYA